MATRDATTGEMTYAITAVHTASNNLNFKATWKYVSNTVTYYETQLFDVVKSILSIPITDDDIYNEVEPLRETNSQQQGTATAGAAGSITDTLNRGEADDYWKGGTVNILSGTGAGQTRDITGFTQSTSVATITPNWTTNPSTDSVYSMIKSFTAKIQQAFEKVETMIYNKGRRHSLILESSQVKFPVLFSVIASICMDLMNEDSDKWHLMALMYNDKFEKAFTQMKVEYDADESGGIDPSEEQTGVTGLDVGRS